MPEELQVTMYEKTLNAKEKIREMMANSQCTPEQIQTARGIQQMWEEVLARLGNPPETCMKATLRAREVKRPHAR